MRNLKGPSFLTEEGSIFFYITLILFLGLVIIGQYTLGIIAGVLIILAIWINSRTNETRKKELNQYLIEFTNTIDDMSRQALLSFPIPLAIIGKEGSVHWYNSKFKEVVKSEKAPIDNIKGYFPTFPLKSLLEEPENMTIDVTYNTKNFNVIVSVIDGTDKDNTVYMLYFIDNTRFTNLKEVYSAEKTLVSVIEVDNFDEISKKMDRVERTSLMARIERELSVLAQRMNGFIIKYLDDRFVMIFENRFFDNLTTKKFDILEDIKEIKTEKDEFFTLSIGVGIGSKTLTQQYDNALGALSIALGRGGDQAVVKSSTKVTYYGGRSKAVEKSTKVKARIMANAIRQIMVQSSNVIITGHRSGDMDSFGAALGMHAIAKAMNKDSYIVLNELNAELANVFERMKQEDFDYSAIIINNETAMKLINENTLGVVVDTHKPSFTEAQEVLPYIERIILVDHHIRGEEYIDDPVLDYLEPYASSTCELIAELFQYMNNQIALTKFEAEVMLAGIMMDTNAFTFKTGVRTFEAASYLRRAGADTVEAKRLLSDDMDTWKRKSEVIERAKIYKDIFAISVIDEIYTTGLIIASQSAADLLSVKGVQASFVLVRRENHIHVSGRSIGKINVQIILEKLGGGGHFEIAGAQIPTKDMEEAQKILKEGIEQYRKENRIQ